MKPSEEVVAAGPDGLIYFMRVQDHPSKPWSEPRPFPPTTASLDTSTVTGLTLHREEGAKGKLHLYCVADGKLHAFSRSEDSDSYFVEDRCPPFADFKVSGTAAVAGIEARYDDHSWCIIAPCESGGILYTSTQPSQRLCYGGPTQIWESAKQIAAHVGIISAVSVIATHTRKPGSYYSFDSETDTGIVTVCIASARLHSIEWPLERRSAPGKEGWESPKCIRVQHPGEVTGNPVLVKNDTHGARDCNLDLLVPSAEGGIFHFVRTPTSPDEWHMVGRVKFPSGVPMASSLTCARLGREFRAHVQCGGRLYLIESVRGTFQWAGCQLYPIEGPGPFPY